jgi:uncharacterized protein
MRIRAPHRPIKFCSFLAILWLVLPTFAALDIDSLKPQGYLSDYANVVDSQSRQQIETYCYRVEQSLGVQIAAVTIPSLDGRDIETVANRLFRHFGVGSKKGDQGVLLLLSVNDRKDRIEVGYGVEQYVTDADSGAILRSVRSDLRGGSYGFAILQAAQGIAARIAQGKGVAPPPVTSVPAPRPVAEHRRSIPFPLLLLGIFFLFWLLSRGGRSGRGGGRSGGGFLPGLLIGSMLGGGRSSGWGGGGFGGWDSGGGGGGGFGGFGGGSSGGGGASSDW